MPETHELRRLAASVIVQAIKDHLRTLRESQEVSERRRAVVNKNRRNDGLPSIRNWTHAGAMASEPTQWLLSDSDAPYSFRWLCTVLDTDPDKIRQRMNDQGLLKELQDTARAVEQRRRRLVATEREVVWITT